MDIQRLSKKLLETLTPEELIAIENGEVILDGNRAESYARESRERTIINKRIYTPKKKKEDFHFVAAWEVLTESTFELGEAIATEDDPKMYFYDRKLVLVVDNDFLELGQIKASEWRTIENGFVNSSLPVSTYALSETNDSFTLTFNTVADQEGWVTLDYYCDIAKFTLSTTFDSYDGILGTAFYYYRAWLRDDPTDTETLGGLLSENDPAIDYTSSSVLSLNDVVVSSHNMGTIKSDEEQVSRTNQMYPYYRYLTVETWTGAISSITRGGWAEWDITVEENYDYYDSTGYYFKVTGIPLPELGKTSLSGTTQYLLDNPGQPWDQYTASVSVVGDGQGGLTGNLFPNNPVFTARGSERIGASQAYDIWAGDVFVGERFEGQAATINVTWSTGRIDTTFRRGRYVYEVYQGKGISHEIQINEIQITQYRIRDYGGYWSEYGVNPQPVTTNETVAYTTTKADYTADVSETELTDQEYTKESIALSLTNTNKVTSIVQGGNVNLANYRYIEIDPKGEEQKWEDDESFIVDRDNWAHWFKVYEQAGNKEYVYLIGFRGSKSTITARRIYARETTINENDEKEYRYAQYLSNYNDETLYEKDIGAGIASLGWVTEQISPSNFTGLEANLSYDYKSLNRLGGSWTHIDKKGWIAWFRLREGRYRGDISTKQYEFLIGFTGQKNKVKKRKIYAIEIDKDDNAKYAGIEDANTVSIDSAITSLEFVDTIEITDFWTNPTSYNLSFSQSPNEIYEANIHKPVSSAQEIVKGRLVTPLSSKKLVDIEKVKPKGLWEGFYPTIEKDYILTYQDKGVWDENSSYKKGDTVKRKEDSETKYRTYIARKNMQPTDEEPTAPDPLTSSDWVLIHDDRLTPISPEKYKLISDTIGYF